MKGTSRVASNARQRLRSYYILTKPGIVQSNTIAGLAGYLFASGKTVHLTIIIGLAVGMALVISASCVVNNYIDRDIDKHMQRTKKRPSVTGEIPRRSLLIFASILIASGFAILLLATTWLTAVLGLLGVFFYVVVYGYAKRASQWGTLVGSISGAIPPVAGYVAGGAALDTGALLLFLVLTAWQMPHFYAIAIFRQQDYKTAKIPVWPVVKGIASTKRQILFFIALFVVATLLLPITGYAGLVFTAIMAAAGLWWFKAAVDGFTASDNVRWARQVFGKSIVVLLIFCGMISINMFLP